VLSYVGGSAAGIGGVLDRWIAPPTSRPSANPDGRRTLDLETDLHDSIFETERAAAALWAELRPMALDSCSTEEQVVCLARRYTNALQAAAVLLDQRVARSAALARSCARCPAFVPESRERCRALASHLDVMDASWRERGWSFERSRRNALDYLVLADRP
jgi:hypothetical protein